MNEDQYTATFDSQFDTIIFNNGGNGEQTVDIKYTAVTGYYPTQKNGEGKWEVGSWTAQPSSATATATATGTGTETGTATGTATQTGAPSGQTTLKFTDNQNWGNVYLYA